MGTILFLISFMIMARAYRWNLALVRKYAKHMTHEEVDEIAKHAIFTKYTIYGAFTLIVIEILYALSTGGPSQQ